MTANSVLAANYLVLSSNATFNGFFSPVLVIVLPLPIQSPNFKTLVYFVIFLIDSLSLFQKIFNVAHSHVIGIRA